MAHQNSTAALGQTVPPEPFVDDSVEHFGSVPELKNPPPADGGQEPEIPPTKESLWNENSRLHAVIEELERRLDAVRADLIGVRAQKAAGEPRDWRTDPKVKAKRMDIQDLIVSKDYNTTRDHFQKLDALCEAVATLTASPREKP